MALLLSIDTSSDVCSVALSSDEMVIAVAESDSRNHTSSLLPLIKKALSKSSQTVPDLQAVAVNTGPGSYTGLRVGLAVAKGLCFTASLPLIAINGFDAIANESVRQNEMKSGAYIILSNNKRNGFYFSVYDERLNIIVPAATSKSLNEILSKIEQKTVFVSGAEFHDNIRSSNIKKVILLSYFPLQASHLAALASTAFHAGQFADPVTIQPLYLNSVFGSL